jgi:hypothetical protein
MLPCVPSGSDQLMIKSMMEKKQFSKMPERFEYGSLKVETIFLWLQKFHFPDAKE